MDYQPITKALIDLRAFENNINFVRKKYPHSKIILPVKANAYGHGMVIISKAAEKIGVDYLAIARVKEGLRLRSEGIKLPIMSLGVEFGINIEVSIANDIELSVSSLENLSEIEDIAQKMAKITKIHLKVDTGMSRLGAMPDIVLGMAKRIAESKNLEFTSLYTHLARSEESKDFTEKQIAIFKDTQKKLENIGLIPKFFHIYNSGAILDSYKVDEDYAVRPGIMVYGYSPYPEENKFLKPVMTLKTKVINLKKVKKGSGISYNHKYIAENDAILAVIPLGYGDGIRRNLSNKLRVTINGKNYCQRGTITMDLTAIEVDDEVKLGDEVIVFGKKEEGVNTADTLAELSGTISYEITTAISERVDRIPINEE